MVTNPREAVPPIRKYRDVPIANREEGHPNILPRQNQFASSNVFTLTSRNRTTLTNIICRIKYKCFLYCLNINPNNRIRLRIFTVNTARIMNPIYFHRNNL